MTDRWNPHAPRVLGLEWPVRKSVTYTLDSLAKAYGWIVRSTVTEQINNVTFWVDQVVGGNAKYAVEAYNLDDPTLTPEGLTVGSSTVHAGPVQGTDQDGTGYFDAWNAPGLTSVTQGANCPNTPETAGFGDINVDDAGTFGNHWLNVTLANQGQFARILTSVQSFDLTGQRILAVTVRARAVGVNATIQPVFARRVTEAAGQPLVPSAPEGIDWVGQGRPTGGYLNGQGPCVGATSPDQIAPIYEWRYERNPTTNQFWTAAEVMGYMVSTPRTNVDPGYPMLGVEFYALNVTTCALLFFEVVIEYAADDRQAYGYQDIDQTGFHSIPMTTFTKNAGETLLIVARKISDGTGSITLRAPEADEFNPLGYTTIRPYILNRAGQISLPLPHESKDVAGLLLRRTDAAYSADSQAYMGLTTLEVNNTASVYQIFESAASGVYGYLSAVFATAQIQPPDAPLTCTVRRYVDAVQVGSDIVFQRSDLSAAPQLLQQVGIALDTPATLTANTGYYLQWSSPATPGNGWHIAILGTFNGLGTQNTISYGGTTTPPALISYPTSAITDSRGGQDMPFTLVQSPPAPANFAVAKVVP